MPLVHQNDALFWKYSLFLVIEDFLVHPISYRISKKIVSFLRVFLRVFRGVLLIVIVALSVRIIFFSIHLIFFCHCCSSQPFYKVLVCFLRVPRYVKAWLSWGAEFKFVLSIPFEAMDMEVLRPRLGPCSSLSRGRDHGCHSIVLNMPRYMIVSPPSPFLSDPYKKDNTQYSSDAEFMLSLLPKTRSNSKGIQRGECNYERFEYCGNERILSAIFDDDNASFYYPAQEFKF